MSLLRIDHLTLENFRCFEGLSIAFEEDTTVLFAENGAGKSSVLTAVAMALAQLQPRAPKSLKLDGPRNVRRVKGTAGQWEQPGRANVAVEATLALRSGVTWSLSASATVRESDRRRAPGEANALMEEIRSPDLDWPIVALYDTGRFAFGDRTVAPRPGSFVDRMEGYAGSLDHGATDGPLLSWLHGEVLGDFMALRQGGDARQLDLGVYEAMVRATPGVEQVWYDPRVQAPIVRFKGGQEGHWRELSDGYYAFLTLVGARSSSTPTAGQGRQNSCRAWSSSTRSTSTCTPAGSARC